jgi:hypothetical protein
LPRDSIEVQNGERGSRGARRCSHRRWRRMEAAGIEKGDVGGVLQLDSSVGCSKDRFGWLGLAALGRTRGLDPWP